MKIHRYKDGDGISRETIEGDLLGEHYILDGKIVKKTKSTIEKETQDQEERLKGFPSIPEQLDCLWDYISSISQEDLPAKTAEMVNTIKRKQK